MTAIMYTNENNYKVNLDEDMNTFEVIGYNFYEVMNEDKFNKFCDEFTTPNQ